MDLFSTLSIYLDLHESLKQTARVPRVHVNTVSYLIQRIEELTSWTSPTPTTGSARTSPPRSSSHDDGGT